MSRNTDARIAVSSETREAVKRQLRGGETYDELLRKMADQYEPNTDEAPPAEEVR
jgi:hypothetical protein